MDRIDRILNHDLFLFHLRKNEEAETERRFCGHAMQHFLDVARIGEIINQEEKLGLAREWVYAAALLHDLGKHIQYQDGTPHEIASAQIAVSILEECGFNNKETGVITDAIKCHRNEEIAMEMTLRGLLYRADKASRACFACEAEKECNWKDGKKNLTIRY